MWKKRKRFGAIRRKIEQEYSNITNYQQNEITAEEHGDIATDQITYSQVSIPSTSYERGSVENIVNDHSYIRCNLLALPSATDDDILSCSSSSDGESEYEKNLLFRQQIQIWARERNIAQVALNDLATIINLRFPGILPSDARTILGTAKQIQIKPIQGGEYWHNGLTKSLKNILEKWVDVPSKICLNFNFDGLPIFNSSNKEFWPILCTIFERPDVEPLVIGIYFGVGKPKQIDEYLNDFVNEIDNLIKNGMYVEQIKSKVSIGIRCFICDSPARAYIKDVQNITWSAPPRASLACDAYSLLRGAPPPLVSDETSKPRAKAAVLWRRGSDEFSNKRVSANGTLEVRKQNGSEGVYQCALRHQGGLLLGFPVHLKFASIDKKISITTNNGSSGQLVLTCHARSRPPADVTWMKNDQLIQNSDRFTIMGNDLIVNDLTTDAAGTYSCIAVNPILHKNRTASIWLNPGEYNCPSETEDHKAAPHQDQLLVNPGSNVTLVCPVIGCLKPRVTWFREKGGVTSELEATSQLYEIRGVDEVEAGFYWCSVSYDYGTPVTQKTFNITLTTPVTIELPPVSKEVIRALTIRFNCTAAGYPEPNVTWYKDGKPLQLGGRYNLRKTGDRKDLVVGTVDSDDAGIFQCFADNGFSRATSWAVLRVTGESVVNPRPLGCWPTGPDSVLFKWYLVPGKYTVIAYTIQTSMAGDALGDKSSSSTGLNNRQPTADTSAVISVAKPMYPYVFQVRAFLKGPNSKNTGASDYSKGIICQGQGAPVQFEASNESVSVSWQDFAAQTPGIAQWLLQTRREGSEHNYTLDGNVTSFTLPGKWSGMQVRVMGSRTERWLPQNWTLVPWNDVIIVGKETNIPEDLTVTNFGAREVSLRWRCGGAACAQRALRRYTVCYVRSEDKERCLTTNTESITIDKLMPDTAYEIRVSVKPVGRQPEIFSSPVQVTTQSLVPREPFTLVQYEYTPESVKIFWNGTGNRTVRYSQNITQPVELWATEVVADNFIVLNNLQPSLTTYVMVVRPNSGEKNQPVMTVPPRAEPQKTDYYLSVGLPVGLSILCLLFLAAVCIWRRKKAVRSPNRSRRRHRSPNDGDEEEASEMKSVGGGLVNGGGSKDAGEPLLNGHVHITENPQTKTPNGKMRKGRLYLDAIDLSRHEDQDTTLETVLDADSSTATFNLLDTSRRPDYDLSRSSRDLSTNNSFNKLPDDNMNSELTRSTDFELDNSKIQPTLQPNG